MGSLNSSQVPSQAQLWRLCTKQPFKVLCPVINVSERAWGVPSGVKYFPKITLMLREVLQVAITMEWLLSV